MGTGFESFSNREQVDLNSRGNLGAQQFIPTEHVGQKFNPTDQTPYSPDSPVAKIYNALRPSLGIVKADGSVGTGYVVSSDGFMLTDHHVVNQNNGNPITVIINGSVHTAMWVDNAQALRVRQDLGAPDDLALLKILPNAGETFKPVKFGDPASVKAGDPMVAVGYPKGLGQVFVSPTADLDGLLHSRVQPIATAIRLADWTSRDHVGPNENINRTVIHTNTEVQHGNSGSVLASISPNGEVVVVGTVGMSDVTPTKVKDTNGLEHDNPYGDIASETVSTPLTPTLAFLRNAGLHPDVASNAVYARNDQPILRNADLSVSPPARYPIPATIAELQYRYAAESLFEFS
jgi:S1-C subfamily serine protease